MVYLPNSTNRFQRASDILTAPRVFGLASEVGDGRQNDPEDLLRVERGLAWAGYRSTTNGLTDAIKRFQTDHGLEADGWLRPNGPTAHSLDETIAPAVNAWRERHPEKFAAPSGDLQVAQAGQIAKEATKRFGPAVIGVLNEALRKKSDTDGSPSGGIGNRRTQMVEPPPSVPPSEPDGEEPGFREEFLPANIKPIDLKHPIPENLGPGIYIHPLPDEDLVTLGQILESRGNATTQAELDALRDRLLDLNPGWTHQGGARDRESDKKVTETHIAGPLGGEAGGKLAGKKDGENGDGREGGRRADLTLVSPTGETIVLIQTVDVDRYGKPKQHELDAAKDIFDYARAIEARKKHPRKIQVILIPKQAQLDRIFPPKK